MLLGTRGRALTLRQLHHTLQDSLDYLERKKTPMTNSALRLHSTDGVRAAVDALSGGHPVTRVDGGHEPVWKIEPDRELEAAFYRNSLIHAFLETSIVELALVHAARAAEGERVDAFWAQAMRLRSLLKFDFTSPPLPPSARTSPRNSPGIRIGSPNSTRARTPSTRCCEPSDR